jgi:hypothetical protein
MARAEEPGEARRIGVGAVTRFAYRAVFTRLGLMLEVGWLPLLGLLAALIVPDAIAPGRHDRDAFDFGLLDYLQAAIALLSLSAFAVRWHQTVLLGDARRLPAPMFFRGWLRFLVYSAVIYLALAALLLAAAFALSRLSPALALELGAIVAGVLLAVAILRCGLLFPAAACGRPLGAVEAWRLMRGNSWRLALASVVTALPVTLAAGAITAIMVTAALPENSEALARPPLGFVILTGLLETAADFLVVALGASLLSACYRALVERRGEPVL